MLKIKEVREKLKNKEYKIQLFTLIFSFILINKILSALVFEIENIFHVFFVIIITIFLSRIVLWIVLKIRKKENLIFVKKENRQTRR